MAVETMDAKETYLVIQTMSPKSANEMPMEIGSIPKSIPQAVAAPFRL